MKYQIIITYQTGDSFSSEERTSPLGMEWTSLDRAKEALQAINEHYILYMLLNKSWDADKDQQEAALAVARTKPWFNPPKSKRDMDSWEFQLGVPSDSGSYEFISPFWCGHFESLWNAEIKVVEGSDGMKINFR
jgi:hypothetical protein